MKKRWIFLFLIIGVVAALIFSARPSGNLAVVEIEGGIYESQPLLKQFEKLSKEDSVKAVVLRIDSPGGSVGAAQEIYEGVKRLAEKKKVVASFGSVAASGGYYIALPAHKIIANPGTVTGSIGVRMEIVNLQELLQWARIHPETLKSGLWKDIGSPTRPMTPEEKGFLEGILKKMHAQFKKAVAEGRKIDREKVETLAEGQIFTGEEALGYGLIDGLGNIQEAIRLAGELAGVEKPDVFYPRPEYEGWVDRLFGTVLGKVRLSGFYFLY